MDIPGDVMIGGVFNVHVGDDESPFQCGDIKVQEGFQYTEALRYAIDMVNKVTSSLSLSYCLFLVRTLSHFYTLESLPMVSVKTK